jgi:hypothetical protein
MVYVCPVCGVEMIEIGEGVVGCMDCQLAWYDPVEIFAKATAEAECIMCGGRALSVQWFGRIRETKCDACRTLFIIDTSIVDTT